MSYKVLVCGNLSEAGLKILEQAEGIEVDRKGELSQDQLLEIIASYDGVVVRSDTKITAPVIAAGEKLKVVGRAGTGVDNIDVSAATQRGIVVMNTPGGNQNSVRFLPQAGQMVYGYILPMHRRKR